MLQKSHNYIEIVKNKNKTLIIKLYSSTPNKVEQSLLLLLGAGINCDNEDEFVVVVFFCNEGNLFVR